MLFGIKSSMGHSRNSPSVFHGTDGRTVVSIRGRERQRLAAGASSTEQSNLRTLKGDRSGAYRVFYCTRLADSVLIFHAFAKKTQKTPPHEIALAQKRLKEMLDEES